MRPVALALLLAACTAGVPHDDDDTDPPVHTDDTESSVHTDDTDTDPPVHTDDSDDTDPPEVDADEDGFAVGLDCDDANAAVFPGATESCNDLDDDCDGRVDDVADPPAWRLDRDGDGFGDPGALWRACTVPSFFVPDTGDGDCDDLDPAVFPGGTEVPGDGVDGDCDGVEACWPDLDLDGYGAGTPSPGLGLACDAPFEAANNRDCDDADVFTYPRAIERCGSVDLDCDGVIGDLDADAVERPVWYRDADGDGWGNLGLPTASCLRPQGHTPDATDCDDANGDRNPGAAEVCNAIDDNCDGYEDDQDPTLQQPTRWFYDGDRDGFGDPERWIERCGRSPPYDAATGDDCDDDYAFVRPGGQESVGNALDENCDGRIACFVDADRDGLPGFSTAQVASSTCNTPGYGPSGGDCDDTDPEIQQYTFWADSDRDTWGNASQSLLSCQRPAFFADRPGDCDDTRPTSNPDAPELVGTQRDEDCDGTELCWLDRDGDRAGSSVTIASPDLTCTAPGEAAAADDCDDDDPDVHPGAIEGIGDGLDADCDGRELCFRDDDRDGYGARTFIAVHGLSCALPGVASETGDCDDGDAATSPGAPETCEAGDENCNGLDGDADPTLQGAPTWFRDADGDGLGDPDAVRHACAAPEGHLAVAGDCADDLAAWGATCPWAEVAAGDGLTCGRRTDDAVLCVGDVLGTPPSHAQALAVSDAGGCALVDGLATCWGASDDPRLLAPTTPLFALDVAARTACGLDAFGVVVCWGDDVGGVVLDAPIDDGWSAVAVGWGHACATRGDGSGTCWGTPDCVLAAPTGTPAVRADQVCALHDGVLSCDACAPRPSIPSEPLLRFDDLSADDGGACALTVSGDAACWSGLDHAVGLDLRQLDVGMNQACGVDVGGLVHCWGAAPVPLPGP